MGWVREIPTQVVLVGYGMKQTPLVGFRVEFKGKYKGKDS